MADVINSAGIIVVPASCSVTTPGLLISGATLPAGANFVTLTNSDTTNWLFAKEQQSAGPFLVALPGQSLVIAMGPQSVNNVKNVVGFAGTPSNAGTCTLTAVLSAVKVA